MPLRLTPGFVGIRHRDAWPEKLSVGSPPCMEGAVGSPGPNSIDPVFPEKENGFPEVEISRGGNPPSPNPFFDLDRQLLVFVASHCADVQTKCVWKSERNLAI